MNNTIIKDPNLEPFYISKDKYCYTVIELITPTRTRGKSEKVKKPYPLKQDQTHQEDNFL